MRLRTASERRTTQKYDDTDIHDRHQDEVLQRISPPQLLDPRLCYRGPVIEHNPNLRPAAFPTIPLDQEIEDCEVRVEPLPLPSPLNQPLVKNVRNADRLLDSSQPFDFAGFKDPEMFAATSIDDRWSRDLGKNLRDSQLRTPSPKTLKRSNGPENKIYMQNMKILDRFSRRTEMDWNIAEMATSEDEAEETHHPKELAWNCLSVAQRLSIIDAVDESCNSLETTFKLLRLTPQQRDFTIAMLEERNEYIDAEDAALQMVRDRASEILHGTNQDEIDWLTKRGGYAKLLEDNVYIGVGKIDYVTSTGKDLRLAKRYLITCGLKAELLDSWVNESTVELGETNIYPSTAESRPAAFPTIPFGDVYQPRVTVGEETVILADEPILEAPLRGHTPSVEQPNGIKKTIKPIEKRVIETAPRGPSHPPMGDFIKTKQSTENTNRRHTMQSYGEKRNDEGKLQHREDRNGSKGTPRLTQNPAQLAQRDAFPNDNWHGHGHASSEPSRSTQTSMGNRMNHPSANPNGQNLRQALSDPKMERYQAPAQAQMFALPPQLDPRRRSWVPDKILEPHQVPASNRLTVNPYFQINAATAIKAGNHSDSRADANGFSRQSLNRTFTMPQSTDPRSYISGREDSFRRTSNQTALDGNNIDRSRDTPAGRAPPARMLPPRPLTDISMIDPALRQQVSRDPRLPTIHRTAEQNRQANPVSSDNGGGILLRKRTGSNAFAPPQLDGDMRAKVQPKEIDGNDVDYAPSKKAKTVIDRR